MRNPCSPGRAAGPSVGTPRIPHFARNDHYIKDTPVRFSRFFIDRPIFAVVLSLAVLAGGLLSIFALPISEYPEVAPPTISVRAVYPGANPTVLAQTVGTPLEEAINGV